MWENKYPSWFKYSALSRFLKLRCNFVSAKWFLSYYEKSVGQKVLEYLEAYEKLGNIHSLDHTMDKDFELFITAKGNPIMLVKNKSKIDKEYVETVLSMANIDFGDFWEYYKTNHLV